MRTHHGGWRAHVLVLAAYALLALLLTWPLAAHPGTCVPGNGADDPPLTWNLWWVGQSLLARPSGPFACDLLFYPLGINLAFYTLTILNAFLSLPLQATAGLIPATNLLLLSSFVLSGYGTFLLTKTLLSGGHRRSPNTQYLIPFLSGLIYAFASGKLFYAALGQWNIASSQWIPFYALCLVKIEAEPRPRRAVRLGVLAGLFLLFQAYAELTYASFLVLFTAAWLAWPRPGRARAWAGLLGPAAAIGLVLAAGLAPTLAAMLPEMRAEGHVLTAGGGFADVFSADLLGFLVPTMLHPLLGTLVGRLSLDHSVGQQIYPGYVVLALAALGAAWGWRRAGRAEDGGPARGGGAGGVRFWAVSAGLFWLLTLGPSLRVNGHDTGLPLPFALVARLPFFEGNRYPSRYGVVLMLCLAVLAGWGLAGVLGRLARRRAALARPAAALVAALILFEHLSVPLPLSDMRVPGIYRAVAALPGETTLLDLPVGWRNGARVTGPLDTIIMFEEYYQVAHGKRLLGGNTSRNPELKFQYFTEAPVVNTLIALETGHAVDAAVVDADRALAAQVLRFFDVGAVVVHTAHVPAGLTSYVESALPVRPLDAGGAADPAILAYTTELPPWPEAWTARPDDPLGQLSYGEGWGAPGGGVAWAQRRAVRLLVPSDGTARAMAFRAYVPRDGQRVLVTVNGAAAGSLALAPGRDDYRLVLPAGALREGLNEVWLRFDRLYPASEASEASVSPRAVGATGVESPAAIVVESAGQDVGDFAHVYVNGHDVAPNERGYNLVVLDPRTGAVEQAAAFDTHLDPAASARLAAAIAAIPPGRIVAVAAADEASRLLGPEAVAALGTLGAAGDLRGKFRWSHALLGVKGAAPGTALEALSEIRPARVVAGEPLTEPRAAAAIGPITFSPTPTP